MNDLSHKKFGRLTVVEKCGSNKDKRILWLCDCTCGNKVVVIGKLLSNGATKSCGCFRRAIATKHGYSRTATYRNKTQCLTAWAEETGISRATIKYRLDRGWSIQRVFEHPTRKYRQS